MEKTNIYLAIFLVSVILPSFLLATPENKPGLTLKETFDIYVQSIQNSDLKNLFTTVTDNENFFFLTSRGKLINSLDGYYKFHEEWFELKDWEMPVELLEVQEGKEYGYTTAIFHYKQKMPEGGQYNLDSYFTLVFRKEDGMWKVVADVCTPFNRYYTEENTKIKYTSDQVYLFDIMKNRRTVRKFKSTPVPREHVLKILDAARFAPTAGNQQPWRFLVIQDRKKLNQLQKAALSWYLDAYKMQERSTEEELSSTQESLNKLLRDVLSAPVYIVILVDSKAKYSKYILYDGTLAVGNLMIAARALGYGTGFFTSFFPEEKMKDFLNIPDQYRLICFTPIGIPDEWPKTPPKKKLEEIVIFESF
ncbi:MAG: nitroreductase family protein [Candidatus Aminicenantaceae bacterium]